MEHAVTPPADEPSRRLTRRVTTALLVVCVLSFGLTYVVDSADGLQTSDRQVLISLGDNNSGSQDCPRSDLPCRWINITLRNFAAGTFFVECVYRDRESTVDVTPKSGNIRHDGSAEAYLNNYCSFNVPEGQSVYVIIDGEYSNYVRITGQQMPTEEQNPTPKPDNTTVPTIPTNLRVALEENGRNCRVSWDAPSNDGGTPITGYIATISRPAISPSIGPWSITRNYGSGARSLRSCGRLGATYTVTIAAKNRVGTSVAARGLVSTIAISPPSKPRNVSVVSGGDRRLKISWNAPARSGSSWISQYIIEWSRPSIGGDGGWRSRDHVLGTVRSSISPRLVSGRLYAVKITAVNSDGGRSSATCPSDTCSPNWLALATPVVEIDLEGRSWFIDDPDALASWGKVRGANSYHVDWRHMKIDLELLNGVLRQLDNPSLPESKRITLTQEATTLLEGAETRVYRGDSATRDPESGAEAACFVQDRVCQNLISGKRRGFDPNTPSHRIHSIQDDLVLQVRVRAHGAGQGSSWSKWVFHPSSKLSVGCQALDVYNTIQNFNSAINTANWILTAAGIVAAAFTAGTSVAASQGMRQAIIFIAKEIVKHILKNVTLKNIIVNLIKDLAVSTVKQTTLDLAAFMFGCITDGSGLEEDNIRSLGEEMIQNLKDKTGEYFDVDKAIENLDTVLQN